MQHDDRQWRLTGLSAGLWCIVVGLGMIVFWLAEPAELAARHPEIFGMKFNAALAFTVLGAAFLLALSGHRALPAIGALAVLGYGVVALAQHVFAVDLGIDQALYRPFTDIGTSLPGRIAPNTALCFILISLAVIRRALRGESDIVQIACSYAAVAIAATALIGYLIDFDAAHDWVAYTRMSVQSATCFLALGVGILFIGARTAGYHRLAIAASLGVATYLILLTLAYLKVSEQAKRLPFAIDRDGISSTAATLLDLILLSGLIYAGLLAYSYWSSRRYRRSATHLSESQGRLAAIINAAVDGILTVDANGTILSANPACERIFGHAPEDVVGKPVRMLLPGPPGDGAEATGGGHSGAGYVVASGETDARRKDGRIVPVELSVARVELAEGTVHTAIIRDISERKHFERQLLAANAELEEFAYRTSHDLRSPIASSIGLLNISRELLENGDHDALSGTLERMERNFTRLDHLIQNIIVLTRDRLLEEEDRRISPFDVVQSQADTLSTLEEDGRVRIANHIPPQLTISTKPSKFEVIVGNLLSNAIKYHDPGETDPRVDVHIEEHDGRIRLVVEDNGLGVPEEKRPLLFRMFKRLHPSRSFGSGLGLYILKKSAESLGGSVTFEARDKGSRFIVELPNGDGHEAEHHTGGR